MSREKEDFFFVCQGYAVYIPGPHDPEPRDGLPGGEARVPHHPEPDERAGAAEARAAVHGDGAVDGLAGDHEALHHVVGRHLLLVLMIPTCS